MFLHHNSYSNSLPARRSTIYPVMGDPPSLAGASQVNLQDLPIMSDGSGAPGALGTAKIKTNISRLLPLYLLLSILTNGEHDSKLCSHIPPFRPASQIMWIE